MLENPQDESVVRWGNEGDSFVVLEVRLIDTISETEREGGSTMSHIKSKDEDGASSLRPWHFVRVGHHRWHRSPFSERDVEGPAIQWRGILIKPFMAYATRLSRERQELRHLKDLNAYEA